LEEAVRSLILLVGLLAGSQLATATTLQGTPCPANPTFAQLISTADLRNFGCDFGVLNYRFGVFGKLENGDIVQGPITASDVDVIFTNSGGLGVSFFSNKFLTETFTTPQTYFLSYAVDPPPIIVGESLTLDFADLFAFSFASLSFNASDFSLDDPPNSIVVTQRLCVNNQFRSGFGTSVQCGIDGNPASYENALQQQVSLDNPTASTSFAATPLVSVRLYIELSGNLSQTGLQGIGSAPTLIVLTDEIPEPFSMGLTGGGLALVGIWARRRQKSRVE
jgi:hypothetical protein